MPISIILQQQKEAADDVVEDPSRGEHPVLEVEVEVERTPVPDSSPPSPPPTVDECKTHLCFEFISHAILCILYPYSCKTHKVSSKLGFVGLLMKSK